MVPFVRDVDRSDGRQPPPAARALRGGQPRREIRIIETIKEGPLMKRKSTNTLRDLVQSFQKRESMRDSAKPLHGF
jgi:hypothetical protein